MAACGVFVAAEFSLVTVDRAEVDQAATTDRAGAGVAAAVRRLSTQLSGAQVGITVTNLAIGFLAEPAIADLIRDPLTSAGVAEGAVSGVAIAIALTAATAVTMVFGELVPKNLAIAHPMAVARAVQGPQRAFTAAAGPIIRLFNGSANAVLRMVGVEPQEELGSARSRTELTSLVRRSREHGSLAAPTALLIERSLAFGQRTAEDVQTPRTRMRWVGADQPVSAVIDSARETGLSRFPVTGVDIDDVVGLVHVKQAVAVPPERRDVVRVAEIAAPPIVVPGTLDLDALSEQLRGHGLQMAVVMDEYGGVAGLVTLEDLVEELVGEIADEHDAAPDPARPLPDGTWSVSGLLRIDEVRQATGLELPESEVYETVAGLVLHALGRMPVAGDVITVDGRIEAGASTAAAPHQCRPGPSSGTSAEPVAVSVTITVASLEGLRIDRVSIGAQPAGVSSE